MTEYGQTSNRKTSGSGSGSSSSTGYNFLRFPGSTAPTGWHANVELGPKFWAYSTVGVSAAKVVVAPSAAYRAMLRDYGEGGFIQTQSAGGSHVDCIGLQPGVGSTAGMALPYGNIATNGLDGAEQRSAYQAFLGPQFGEWADIMWYTFLDNSGHVIAAVTWDGFIIGTNKVIASGAVNNGGIQVARVTPVAGQGHDYWPIGHVDHQPPRADIAQVQQFYGAFPCPPSTLATIAADQTRSPFKSSPFWPERSYGQSYNGVRCVGLWQMTSGGSMIPDLSDGFDGGDGTGVLRKHPGKLNDYLVPAGLPVWGYDSSCPLGRSGDITNLYAYVPSAGSVPANAIHFDSGGGRYVNALFQVKPDIGSTDSRASGGAKTWLQGMMAANAPSVALNVRSNFWVLQNGWFRTYEPQPSALYYDSGLANIAVRIERFGATDTHPLGHCGVFLRSDAARQNFIAVWTATRLAGQAGGSNINIQDYRSGSVFFGNTFSPAITNWKFLCVVGNGTTITIYVSADGSTWSNAALPSGTMTYTDTVHNARTYVGQANFGGDGNSASSAWMQRNWATFTPANAPA